MLLIIKATLRKNTYTEKPRNSAKRSCKPFAEKDKTSDF